MVTDPLPMGPPDAPSNHLAHPLRATGCERGDRVCVLLPNCPMTVTSLLGILKADACYVPLDTTSPPLRIAKILESAEPRVILAGARGAATLNMLRQQARLPRCVRIGWMHAERSAAQPCQAPFTLEDV